MDADRHSDATRDAVLRARLQAAFAAAGGEGDVLDELWWRERAGRPHPEGLRDPALERLALVEAAYCRAQSEQDARQAAAALRAFESRRRRQTDALDGALAEIALHPPQPAADAVASSTSDAGATRPADDPTRTRPGSLTTAEGSPTLPSFARRHRPLLSVAALVVAAAVGALAVAAPRSPAPTAPTAPPSAEVAAATSLLAHALARVQVPTDALPSALRPLVDPRSSRLLYDAAPAEGDTGERWRLWVGTGENPSQLCFVTTFDNVRNAVTCLPRAAAIRGRIVVTDDTADGTFEARVDDGAVAVHIR